VDIFIVSPTVVAREMSENRTCLFSGIRREVDENSALLGYYAAIGGNSLPTFRDNLSIPSSGLRIFEHVMWDRQVSPKRR